MTASMPDKGSAGTVAFSISPPGGSRAQVRLDGRYSADSTHGWRKTTRGGGETMGRPV